MSCPARVVFRPKAGQVGKPCLEVFIVRRRQWDSLFSYISSSSKWKQTTFELSIPLVFPSGITVDAADTNTHKGRVKEPSCISRQVLVLTDLDRNYTNWMRVLNPIRPSTSLHQLNSCPRFPLCFNTASIPLPLCLRCLLRQRCSFSFAR